MKLSNKLYDILNLITRIYLPLIATFYITIAEIWKLPYPKEISATIMAIDTLIGSILTNSSLHYNKSIIETKIK